MSYRGVFFDFELLLVRGVKSMFYRFCFEGSFLDGRWSDIVEKNSFLFRDNMLIFVFGIYD